MTLLQRLAPLVVFALLPYIAHAAPCSGFTDVDSANFFCPNVDWLRNRGVTLGCTATTYCPDEPVTRLQMAAFMNRLGTAFTPLVLYQAEGDEVFVSSTSFAYVCMTADVAIFDFRRFATAISTVTPTLVTLQTVTFISSRPVMSTNGGVTWQGFDPTASVFDSVSSRRAPDGFFNSSTAIAREAAIYQGSYRFAIELGSAYSAWVNYLCQLRVSITNRNGTNVPY